MQDTINPIFVSGESTSLSPLANLRNARLFQKPPLSFAAPDGYDLETRQHLLNGLKHNQFSVFVGQLSDIDYAGQQSKDKWSQDVSEMIT